MLKRLILLMISLIMCFIMFNTEATTRITTKHTATSFPVKIPPLAEPVFIYNPRILQWAVYDINGNRIEKGKANGGNVFCPDIKRGCRTPSGSYRILSKGTELCKSKLYPIKRKNGQIVRGGAHMPYCMYFSEAGYAIHGYSYLSNHNNSHGCIRVTKDAAQWLSTSVMHVGSKVIVMPY